MKSARRETQYALSAQMGKSRKNFMEDVAFVIIFDKRAKCCQVEIQRIIWAEVRKGG